MKPKFDDLWTAYGELLETEGTQPCDGGWDNQCAIRMSISLISAGMSFAGYTEPKCKHGHARGAESLANWLWRNHLKRPKVFAKPETAKRRLQDAQGIMFFKNCFTRDGETTRSGDHIDLWDRGQVKTYDDPKNMSQQVWFWSLD